MSESKAPETMLYEQIDANIARITFNRPEKRNAMNQTARLAFMAALDRARSCKVVILTGNGPAFCAGVDRKDTHPDSGREWRAVQEAIRRHPSIVISAVNGFALGGGATLINASELAIAAETAQIGMPEITFGVYPALAGPSTQLRLSQKRAAWMILTGDRITGKTAEEWGLVNKAVPLEKLQEEAMAVAKKIAGYDAVTLEYSKKALWDIPHHLSDWMAVLDYGELANGQIQRRRAVLERVAKGEAGKGDD
jgi:enoyl-CoA hydratase/carnithine racemase